MKRQIPILLVFVAGLVMLVQYFVPHEASEFLYTYAMDWIIVIGVLSLPIGIYSLVRATARKARAEPRERLYSIVTLAGFLAMVISGIPPQWWGPESGAMRFLFNPDVPDGLYRRLFDYVLTPAQASLFAMLAFYIASAAYRAFRVRTLLAATLLLTASIVMLRMLPLPDPLGTWVTDIVRWILFVPNLAAKRAIIIGIALGAVAYGLKILLGIERSYMGRE